MKRTFLLFVLFFIGVTIYAQDGYEFKDVIRLPATSVKDQYASGTCWAFSGVSFLESEMARKGMKIKNVPDLSEMFIVRKMYEARAKKYVRLQGKMGFGEGAEFGDVFWVMKNFGLMPEQAYPGLNYGTKKHNHTELNAVLQAEVDAFIKEKQLTPVWFNVFNSSLDVYLGKVPETFKYKGKTYTPKSFAKEVVGLDPDDYMLFTSFTHHPFYTAFPLEVTDNWMWTDFWNVTIDELEQIVDNALKNGYTVAWAADVSEPYFSYSKGVAVVPDLPMNDLVVTERARWTSTNAEKYHLDKPGKEKKITQEMRQQAFDNYATTDDHGMHIVGLAKDQNGTEYYIVKNSWNTGNPYKGYIYVSKAYFRYKTMSIAVHKDAVPKEILAKLKK